MNTFSVNYIDYEQLKKIFATKLASCNGEIFVQVLTSIIDKDYIKDVCHDIIKLVPAAKIIGSTTYGEIQNGKSTTGTCLISVMQFATSHIETVHVVATKTENVLEKTSLLSNNIKRTNVKATICFISLKKLEENFSVEHFLISSHGVVAGGIAGGSEKNLDSTTYVFDNNGVYEYGAVIANFSGDELIIHTDVNFGWVAIGKEYTITETNGNWIKSINNISAKQFYEHHLGHAYSTKIGATFPFICRRDGIETSFPLFADAHRDDIYIATLLQKGDIIRFGFGDKATILNQNTRFVNNIENKSVESVFTYSCAGRKIVIDNLTDAEVAPLNEVLPVNGAYFFAQFSHFKNKNHLLMQTVNILGFSEDFTQKVLIPPDYTAKKFLKNEKEIVLHHLIKSTGDELMKFTKDLEATVHKKTKELQLSYQTDAITGLYNRIKMQEDLSQDSSCFVAFIKLPEYYGINSFYGLETGDKIIKKIVKAIKNSVSSTHASIYRVQEDTLGFLCQEGDFSEFILRVKNIQREIETLELQIKSNVVMVDTIVIVLNEKDHVIEKYGLSIDYCKRQNLKFLEYNEKLELLQNVEKNINMVYFIRNAIRDDRVVPYFQPIVNNITGKIVKYESLMRIIDTDGQVVAPGIFLNIAKLSGLYDQLTRIMITKTFEAFKNTDYEFSINLLLNDIQSKTTRDLIRKNLRESEIAHNAVFEIVETEGIEDFDEIIEFITEVRQQGVKIAIDDFGTGYSNFSYLIRLSVDYIKIDGSIIKEICTDTNSLLVTKAIVDFSKNLGAKTIGEFVATEEIYTKAVALGVDFSQGYYFSQPLATIK